jgi:hypothetical protein
MKHTQIESILLGILLVTFILGLYWGFTDPDFFTYRYMMEDGEIEYATVGLLLASCVLVVIRWFRLHRYKSFKFSLVSILVVVAFFFVAGEEVSWGQRIFDIQTTEYFKQHNAQGEMNLHNIVVGDVKVNKLVFGVILTTLILVYIVAVPILYRRVSYIKNLLDNWYIPVPKVRHSVAYLVIMLIILIIPNSKKWELLEFGSVLIFFLIMLTPYNHRIFRIIPE